MKPHDSSTVNAVAPTGAPAKPSRIAPKKPATKLGSAPPFDEVLASPRNNLNIVRLVAAGLVTFSHAYALTGREGDEPLARWTQFATFGSAAVYVFFIISGLLVARSFDRQPRLVPYLAARALRIYPALAVVLLLTALGLGVWATTLPAGIYVQHPDVWRYVTNNLLFTTQFTLPGVFESNPYPSSVNGSLWTLRYEVYAYLLVIAFGMLGLLRSRLAFNVAAVGLVLIYMKAPQGFALVPADWPAHVVLPLVGFLLGMGVYVNREVAVCSLRVALGLAVCAALAWGGTYGAVLWFLALGYATLVVGLHPKLHLPIAQHHDYSYGVYIYSFPVQQSVALLWPDLTPLVHFVMVAPVVLVLSALSWHLIEKPSLALKRLWHRPGQPVAVSVAPHVSAPAVRTGE
jgi:peptidoglycan/LPS O-acetylase OafA/YrhL